ncbi:DNRLRE domain-containing protein [Nonomuraea sp. NPDC005692]|uniref:DNRLRE domain-containing protein n=1 Tax=Nonomuraea sp. NPDC005692 TaxID=3157168 RepID=UPI0033D9D25A
MEVVDETTATSITYALPDGKTFKTEVTTAPVRTKLGNEWVPIDTTLAEQGGRLRPKAIVDGAVVEISAGGSDPFVKMAVDGKSYALRWPTPLPKPTVKGSVATYTDAAGVGADLVVTALPTGFRHDVILRQRPSKPLEMRIGVEDEDLTLSKDKGGRLLLKDASKKLVASAPQPLMWDASAQGRLPFAKHAKVDVDVVAKDGGTELVLKPDHAFLAHQATIYPVLVNPATATLPLSTDIELVSSHNASNPANGTYGFIMAGTQDNLQHRVHLKFDTSSLTGATVTDAKLSMNNIDSPACGPTVGTGIQVARLTSSWDPTNLYWANKPTLTTEDASTNTKGVTPSCSTWPDTMDWNVTGIAQDWASGATNHGLVLKTPAESTVKNYRTYTAAENTESFGVPPKLVITTSGPASSPTVTGLSITPAQTVNGATVTSSLTPQLAATVADAIGGNLAGEFEVEHDPSSTGQGVGRIWSHISPSVASGEQSVVSVPAEKLSDGWNIRWRARAVNAIAATTSAWSVWQNVTVHLPAPQPNPTVGTLQVAPAHQVDGSTIVSSLTPNLLAQVSDGTAATLRAEFELEHDPAAAGQGTGQIWAGAADNVASGSQAIVTVPDNLLADGWKVRWRARATAGDRASAWSDWQLFAVDVTDPGEEPLAQTTGPVLRTDQSFTVASWLRWSDKEGNFSVAEQRGTHQAPFRLGNTPDHGLVFTMPSADAADPTIQGIQSGVEPPVGEWFHLAGTYDAATKTATLYLNGSQIGTNQLAQQTWHAETPMRIGSSMAGSVDDMKLFQRALSSTDIADLHSRTTSAVSSGSESLNELSPAAPATADAATAGKFNYEHMNTADCMNTQGDYNYFQARIQEKPYASCRSAYYYLTDYEEEDSTSKRMVKSQTRSNAFMLLAKHFGAGAFRDDDNLRFRATWVMHSYLGDTVGENIVYPAGDLKPQDIKIWMRIDEIAVEDAQGRVKISPAQMKGLNMGAGVNLKAQDPGSTCVVRKGDRQIKDVSAWYTSPEFEMTIRVDTTNPLDAPYCTILPMVAVYDKPAEESYYYLWSQYVKDENGLERFVRRKGDTVNQQWETYAPWFRCDKMAMGFGDYRHVGGCINPQAGRIFTMSKTADSNFIQAIEHIQDAMDPKVNKTTFPPLRPGHYWSQPSYPPPGEFSARNKSRTFPEIGMILRPSRW